MSTIVVRANDVGMSPSLNANFITLTSFSQSSMSGSFYLVASLSHTFKRSSLIPDGPPVSPILSLRTATEIYYPYGGPSTILPGCTSIGVASPSGGRRF